MNTKIHTAQLQTLTKCTELDCPAIKNQNGTALIGDEYRVKFNPEGVEGVDINTKSGFYTALGITIAECELENVRLNRIDICWDFMDKTFTEMYRPAKLLLYCMAVQIGYTGNISDTIDGFNIKKKSVKVQNTKDSGWIYQFEYYNKKLQKPKQPVMARLEFRRSGLVDTTISELDKVNHVAHEFISILSAIASERGSVYTQTVKELNNNLMAAWKESGCTSLRNFINQNVDSFLAKGQIADFIRRVRPDINNVGKRAQQITESIGLQMYDKSDLKELISEMITSLRKYLQS